MVRCNGLLGGMRYSSASATTRESDFAESFEAIASRDDEPTTFAIAESVGDLIHRNDESATKNLRAVLETEFEAVRPGYRDKATFLALMFRHSLAHTDQVRKLVTKGRELRWLICQ